MRERGSESKAWQIESYLFVILFCCRKWMGFGWEIQRIIAVYEIAGNIFEWQTTKEVMSKIESIRIYNDELLILHFRLVPEEWKDQLMKQCEIVLMVPVRDTLHSRFTKDSLQRLVTK